MKPILLLTRPEAQARRFAEQVAAGGIDHDPVFAPLTQIAPIETQPSAFEGASGLILTSANAVAAIRAVSGLQGMPAWCVGPATTRAAMSAGFNAVNAGGDAAALIETLAQARPQGRLLHPHGTHVARDLASDPRLADMQIEAIPVYEAAEIEWPVAVYDMLAQGRAVVAPLFSPRAAEIFTRRASKLRAQSIYPVAISQNCADRLPTSLQTQCRIAKTPDSHAMLQSVNDALSQAAGFALRRADATHK